MKHSGGFNSIFSIGKKRLNNKSIFSVSALSIFFCLMCRKKGCQTHQAKISLYNIVIKGAFFLLDDNEIN